MCGGSSQSTSSTTIPPQLLQAYQGVTNAAQNFYGSTTPQNYSSDVNQFVAPLNSTQNAGMSAINNASGQAQPYYQAATAGLGAAQNATAPYYQAATGQLAQGIGTGASGTQAAYGSMDQGLGAAGALNAAAAGSMGSAYAGAQPYNAAASQGTASAQNVGSGLAGASLGSLGQAQQQGQGYTQAGYNAAQPYNNAATGLAAAGAGQVNAQQIGSNQINQFESPYINDVTQSQLALLNQQNQTAMSGQTGNAIQSGAFGGDRAGIAAANLQQQQDVATNSILSNSLNSAYSQALGAAQQQQGVNLSAGQANRAAVQNAATQMQGIGQQQYAQGTGTGAQLYGQGANTASQLGALGQQQFGQGLSAAQEQAALGQQGYSQGMGLSSAEQGLGASVYGQGLGASQQQAALAQQQFGQGVTGATTAAGLGQDIYNTGAQTSAAMANLGAGAQSAALQGGQAQMAAGQTAQQTQQAGLQAMYNQWYQTNYGLPQSLLGSYAGAIEGIGQNEGSTTTTTTPGGLFSFLSDERAKENIKIVGKLHDGQKIYSYNYKGDPRTQIGLLAQEVEKKHPEAVGETNGWKTVDYAKATADSERARKAAGGEIGGYDPSAWGQILSSEKGSYSGSNSTVGGLGPAAPPNFSGTPYTAPQPGPHGGSSGGSSPQVQHQAPGSMQQATQNNMTGLLQTGEAALGKQALGAAQNAYNANAINQGFVAPSAAAITAAAGAPTADLAATTLADTSTLSTALPELALAPIGLNTGGRIKKDTGGGLYPDPNSDTSTPNKLQVGLGRLGGLIGQGVEGLASAYGAGSAGLMGYPADQAGSGQSPSPSNSPPKGLGAAPQPQQQAPAPQPTINPTPMNPNAKFHAPSGGFGAIDPSLLTGGDASANDPSVYGGDQSKPYGNIGSLQSGATGLASPAGDKAQGEALASTAQAAATSANVASGNTGAAQGTAQKAVQHASNAEAAKSGAFHGIGDILGGLGSAADGVVNAAAPGIGKAANAMTGGLAGAAANFGGNLIDGAKAGLGGYGHQLSQGDPNAWIPLLKGVGAMAAAPTRNWGTALTQGLAAGASAYYPTQQEQAQVANTQSETGLNTQVMAHTYATTAAAWADAAKKGLIIAPDPNGDVKTPGGNFKIVGTKSMMRSALHPDEAGSSTDAAAPTSSIPSAKPQPGAIGDYGKKLASNNDVVSYNQLPDAQKTMSDQHLMDTYNDASQTDNSRLGINKYAESFVGSGGKSGLAPGGLTPYILPIAGVFNDTMDKLGLSGLKFDPHGLTNDQIVTKMQYQVAQAKARGANEKSLGALEAAMGSTPGAGMDQEAGTSLLADSYIQNTRMADKAKYFHQFEDASGTLPGQFNSYDAERAFQTEHSSASYEHERSQIKKMLQTPGFPDMMKAIEGGGANAKKMATWIDSTYGPGMSRHFMGGT